MIVFNSIITIINKAPDKQSLLQINILINLIHDLIYSQ